VLLVNGRVARIWVVPSFVLLKESTYKNPGGRVIYIFFNNFLTNLIKTFKIVLLVFSKTKKKSNANKQINRYIRTIF
jgi:hypothetical protein